MLEKIWSCLQANTHNIKSVIIFARPMYNASAQSDPSLH